MDRALNDRKGISEATKEKILTAAKAYGYRPNMHARSIAGGKAMLIGVVVFDLKNQYFSDILMHIEENCGLKGYSTVVMFTDKKADKEIECVENLYHMAADGIVICPINHGEEFQNFLSSLNIPVVTIGNRLKGKIPYVGIDNAQSMRDTVKHIKQKGYEAVVYVSPTLHLSDNTFAQEERCKAFKKTAEAEGLEYVLTDIAHAEAAIPPNKKTAFICPTDTYAVRLLEMARSHGAGIIGFDNIRLLDQMNIKLDSVSYDMKAAAKAVVDYIVDGKPIPDVIEHHIVERGSV